MAGLALDAIPDPRAQFLFYRIRLADCLLRGDLDQVEGWDDASHYVMNDTGYGPSMGPLLELYRAALAWERDDADTARTLLQRLVKASGATASSRASAWSLQGWIQLESGDLEASRQAVAESLASRDEAPSGIPSRPPSTSSSSVPRPPPTMRSRSSPGSSRASSRGLGPWCARRFLPRSSRPSRPPCRGSTRGLRTGLGLAAAVGALASLLRLQLFPFLRGA